MSSLLHTKTRSVCGCVQINKIVILLCLLLSASLTLSLYTPSVQHTVAVPVCLWLYFCLCFLVVRRDKMTDVLRL